MKISVMSMLRRHIRKLPAQTPFTTRECLGYGLRAAVDQALSRLVKSGLIRRLARGLFVYERNHSAKYSFAEISRLKAESFRRELSKHTNTTLKEIFGENARRETEYLTNGTSSRFNFDGTIISLQEQCQRKAALSETAVGERLKSLWSIGKTALTLETFNKVMNGYLGGVAKKWMRENISLLPAWLSDRLFSLPNFRYEPVTQDEFFRRRTRLSEPEIES